MTLSINPLPIFDRILNRLNDDRECQERIMKYFSKRADVEEKFVDGLNSCISDDYNKNNKIESILFEELKSEIKLRKVFIKELREKLKESVKDFLSSTKTSTKDLTKTVTKYQKEIMSMNKRVENAQSKLQENTQKLLLQKDPKKYNQQLQYVEKIGSELEKESREKNRYLLNLSNEFPKVQSDFDKLDQQYQGKAKNFAVQFNTLKQQLQTEIHKQTVVMQNSISSLDVEDSSKRFVEGTFNNENAKVQAAASQENASSYAFAISDYKSESPQDLSFVVGDKIKVLNMHSSGWWDGELDGKHGLFPKGYVKLENDYKQTRSKDMIEEAFVIIIPYNPINAGDIEVMYGDIVIVNVIEDGICKGKNLRTEEEGTFPASCVLQKI